MDNSPGKRGRPAGATAEYLTTRDVLAAYAILEMANGSSIQAVAQEKGYTAQNVSQALTAFKKRIPRLTYSAKKGEWVIRRKK